MPLVLKRNGVSANVVALVDSGAAVSVLPWSIGFQFGIDWDSLNVPCTIGGSAGGLPGKILLVEGTVGHFPPVQLVFAWVKSDVVPTIMGQVNFFLSFDVFFYRARGYFEIQPATAATP
jgi:hypothetical protein